MDAAEWMSALPGELSLAQLSIPGTHDSCALHDHELLADTAKCQDLALGEQLAIGVRFLDIRCRHVRDDLAVVHGVVDQRVGFRWVVEECRGFLRLHPRECLVMSVKEEGDPVDATRPFEDTFRTYVDEQPAAWTVTATVPRLDQARGTIVLLRRFAAQRTPLGIDASAWVDDAEFAIGDTLRVQDRYRVADPDAKWRAVEALFAAVPADGAVLHLNFTSGWRPRLGGLPSIRPVADDINARLAAWLTRRPAGRPTGVVVMDFVDAALAAAVIAPPR